MHAAALQLAPIVATEKSKVPFYIAGGALVAWAMIVSMGIGLRRADFPGTPAAQRAVMAITVVLVVLAVAMAVLTSGTPSKNGQTTTAAASSPNGGQAGAATTSLQLSANPAGQLKYNSKQLSAKAGIVTITMANMAPLEHNVTVAHGATVLGATPTFAGGSRSLKLTLKAGTYTFYCSVPGHRQAGMEGTLTVS